MAAQPFSNLTTDLIEHMVFQIYAGDGMYPEDIARLASTCRRLYQELGGMHSPRRIQHLRHIFPKRLYHVAAFPDFKPILNAYKLCDVSSRGWDTVHSDQDLRNLALRWKRCWPNYIRLLNKCIEILKTETESDEQQRQVDAQFVESRTKLFNYNNQKRLFAKSVPDQNDLTSWCFTLGVLRPGTRFF